MDKDIWIARITDYRKWCVRLYIDVYKGNEHYRNVYYDVRKGIWNYTKDSIQDGIDFDELENISKTILIEYNKEHYFNFLNKDLSGMSFKEISDGVYNYYGEHPEFKSEYNIKYKEMMERRKRLGW
jgi:hypothetical protein